MAELGILHSFTNADVLNFSSISFSPNMVGHGTPWLSLEFCTPSHLCHPMAGGGNADLCTGVGSGDLVLGVGNDKLVCITAVYLSRPSDCLTVVSTSSRPPVTQSCFSSGPTYPASFWAPFPPDGSLLKLTDCSVVRYHSAVLWIVPGCFL